MDQNPAIENHNPQETLTALWNQGLPVSEIARRTGLSPWQARRAAFDHGLTKPAGTENITKLNQRQAMILKFIQDYISEHSYAPSLREITKGCNLSSTSVALYNLLALAQKGYITRTRDVARSIALTGQGCVQPPQRPEKEAA